MKAPFGVFAPARTFMLHVYILQYYCVFHQHIPSYAFIVERQIMKLEDKH